MRTFIIGCVLIYWTIQIQAIFLSSVYKALLKLFEKVQNSFDLELKELFFCHGLGNHNLHVL